MKMLITLGLALGILTVGTVLYIYKDERGQAPVRLMSPSEFDSSKGIADAIARRFWPQFQEQNKHIIRVSSQVPIGLQVWQDVQNLMPTHKSEFSVDIAMGSHPEVIAYSKGTYYWYVLPLLLNEDFAEGLCQEPLSFECLSARASRRNFRKRRGPDKLSVVIEDHHDNNIYIFIHMPEAR